MSDKLRSSELAAKPFSPQSTAQKSLLTGGLHVILFGALQGFDTFYRRYRGFGSALI